MNRKSRSQTYTHWLHERGLLWTTSYILYRVLKRLKFAASRLLIKIEMHKYITGASTISSKSHTIEENREMWNTYNWKNRGEEWTADVLKYRGENTTIWKTKMKRLIDRYIHTHSIILEIGPGAGRWTNILSHKAKKLFLADISIVCLNACKKRFKKNKHISYLLVNQLTLPEIPNNSIDAIWSYDVFVHLHPNDIQTYLATFYRILKPNGIAIIHHAGNYSNDTQRIQTFRSWMTTDFFAHLVAKEKMHIIEQNTTLPHYPGDTLSIFTKKTIAL